jgi:hypothetical protein
MVILNGPWTYARGAPRLERYDKERQTIEDIQLTKAAGRTIELNPNIDSFPDPLFGAPDLQSYEHPTPNQQQVAIGKLATPAIQHSALQCSRIIVEGRAG